MNLPTPRHARNEPAPTLREVADDIRAGYRLQWRRSLRAALDRDLVTSTPAGGIQFLRTWGKA